MNKNKLKKIIIEIFRKYKLSKNHSKICADAIINAELVGAPTHGLSRLKMYCDRINHNLINPKPKIKIKNISQSVAHINGDDSIGFVAADIAIKKAIKNAKKTGIGLVAVKNSGHYGMSGYYAEQAVKKNMMALVFTNAPPAIAPHGAIKSLFGTNPICFGSPTGSKAPFILDTSVSMINRGKIRVASRTNSKIPEGVALDRFGNPTTNAMKALEGVQLPIAGFRGSGAGRVKDPFDDFSGPQNIGHLFIVMKANLFQSNFKKRIKENIKRIKKLPKLKGLKEILYPGENKLRRFKKNLKSEIKIPENIKEDIRILISSKNF